MGSLGVSRVFLAMAAFELRKASTTELLVPPRGPVPGMDSGEPCAGCGPQKSGSVSQKAGCASHKSGVYLTSMGISPHSTGYDCTSRFSLDGQTQRKR